MIKEKLHRCNSGVRKKGYPAPAGFGSKKAVKKKLFVVLLSFVVTLSFVFQPNSNEVYAQNNTVNSERWMTTSGEYDFPISREKGNWDQVCTYNEKVNATIIPEDVLKQITTENLMKLLLDYPLIFDINIYDTKKQGYDMLKKQFNGIDEFLSRSDAADVILNEYEKYSLPSECMIDYDAIIEKRDAVEVLNRMWSDEENIDLVMEDSKVRSRLFLMEYVILDLLHAGKCEADGFIVAYTNKMCEKLHSEYFKGETIESITQAIGDPQAEQMILNYYGLNPATARSSYTVYTPGNHTAVTCNYTSTLTMCNYSDYAASIANAHGTLISLASITFNCHSFAWLKNLYSSNYQHLWMNSASAFAADSYYSSQSSPSAAGRIAYSGLHSAIVQQTSMPNPNHYNIPEPYVVSKWGAGPIVSHFLSEGYPGSYTFYYH